MLRRPVTALLALSLLPVLACGEPAPAAKGKPARPSKDDAKTELQLDAKKVEKQPSQAAEARAFVDRVDGELRELVVAASKAEWEKNTNITDATEKAAAEANEKLMAYMAKAIKDATAFTDPAIDPDTRRKLYLLKVAS
ncbi:MAG TPA: M2 family metallopeptidase, partial [Nannocystis sp.]